MNFQECIYVLVFYILVYGETAMKRKTILVMGSLLVVLIAVVGTSVADEMGPAPNGGDCDLDGSGFDPPAGPLTSGYGPGPAPNSGDGIPDGPGW